MRSQRSKLAVNNRLRSRALAAIRCNMFYMCWRVVCARRISCQRNGETERTGGRRTESDRNRPTVREGVFPEGWQPRGRTGRQRRVYRVKRATCTNMTIIRVDVRMVFVLASGCSFAFFGVHRGPHRTQRAEGALQKAEVELADVTCLATLGELAASIIHEINPLSAIVTNVNRDHVSVHVSNSLRLR